MTELRTAAETYAPMPEPGAIRECWFCHFMVTLREVPGGWYHWTADRDARGDGTFDARRHCDGGSPGNRNSGVTLTLHTPVGVPDQRPLAPRYTLVGEPAFPQDHSARRRLA